MNWRKPYTELSEVGEHRVRESRCGKFRVVLSRILLGERDTYADRWYALVVLETGRSKILSIHRRETAAVKACEREAERYA